MKLQFEFPAFAAAISISGVAMFGPAVAALIADDHQASRSFFYTGLLTVVFSVIVGIAIQNFRPRLSYVDQLFGLLLTFILMPVLLAAPLATLVDSATLLDLYVDMVSCLTTTGAAVAELSPALGRSVEIWRAEVAWLGGFLIWVAAAAILEPLSLGGFEVATRRVAALDSTPRRDRRIARRSLQLHAKNLLPWYLGATAVLSVLEFASGADAVTAIVLSMSTISTSGIAPAIQTGWFQEAIILVFLIFALSSLFVTARGAAFRPDRILGDPELKVALLVVAGTLAAVLLANIDVLLAARSTEMGAEWAGAVWGSLFTTASFLATAGFESSFVEGKLTSTQFGYPAAVLIFLAALGGGVATTAGGIKLLRVLALARLSNQELSRLVYPSTVAASPGIGRELKVSGQEFAWIAFVVFCVTAAFLLLAFAASGLSFTEAAVVSFASLSTTGPLAKSVLGPGFNYWDLGGGAKCLLATAMILGRLEFLTVIALFNPALWRA